MVKYNINRKIILIRYRLNVLCPDVCVSLSAREINPAIQLQAAGVQAMNEYAVLYIVSDIFSFIYMYGPG